MRGLTKEERVALSEPEIQGGPICTDEDVRILELLKSQGRITDRWWPDGSKYYGNTDFGLLALRVCPVDE